MAEPRGFFLNRRGVALLVGSVFFLATLFGLAGPSWELALLRLTQDGACAIAWLTAAGGIGWLAWRVLRPSEDVRPSLALATCVAMGIGVMSLAILGLGLAGWLNRAWAIGMLVGGAAIAIAVAYVQTHKWDATAWLSGRVSWGWLWAAIAPVAGMMILGAFFPPGLLWGDEPNGYDVVEYHLQVPREWYEAGRIIPLSHNVFSYFPFNVEMHYLLAMYLHGGFWGPWAGMYLAQLMHAGVCAVTVLAVYGLCDSPKQGTIAALLVAATPWTALLGAVAYDDGGTLLFGILAIGWAMRARSWRGFVIAGAMAGWAAGTKLAIVPLLLVGVPLVLLVVRRAMGGCAGYVLAALVVFSPWLIRNQIWAGNPVLPEAMSVLGKGQFSDVQAERWRQAYLPDKDHRTIEGHLSALATQALIDPRYGFALFPLGCAAMVLAYKRQAAVGLGILAVFQLVFWFFFTHLQSRFLVIEIPIIALLVAQIDDRRWLWLSTGAAVGIACVSCIVMGQKLNGNEKLMKPRFLHVDHELARTTGVGVIGVENLRGMNLLDIDQLRENESLDLVGDARAFLYQIPMSRLHYKTVFDVDTSDAKQSIIEAWLAGMPTGARMWVDEPELNRFSRTYYRIPALSEARGGASSP
jgi:hypothetical protein